MKHSARRKRSALLVARILDLCLDAIAAAKSCAPIKRISTF
ncbi:hypothetical protein [Paraburkholderia sprentiae]|nr:hypothetical protein [Paraburkholderia sprentiae]